MKTQARLPMLLDLTKPADMVRYFLNTPKKGCYPPAGEVEKAVNQKDIKICTGGAGTMIFCDTSGLHKGGYAIAKERIMFTGGFVSSASVRKTKFRYQCVEGVALSSQARFALKRSIPKPQFYALYLYKLLTNRGDE